MTQTLRIGATSQNRKALDVGISIVSDWTATRDAMVDGHTFSVLAAIVFLADVDATSIKTIAELMRGAVDVVLADVGRCVQHYGGEYKCKYFLCINTNNRMFVGFYY